jgi:hypothetical protein
LEHALSERNLSPLQHEGLENRKQVVSQDFTSIDEPQGLRPILLPVSAVEPVVIAHDPPRLIPDRHSNPQEV